MTASNRTIAVPKRDFEMMLLSTFRYSLGRMTYITGLCAEWLAKWWDDLPTQYQQQIHQDIEHAIRHGLAGHDCDVTEWKKVLQLKVRES